MSRYLIIGCSGSGKSTLAQQLSNLCQIPYINTDALYWRSDWSVVPEAEVIAGLDLEAEAYVLDGNFVSSREEVWSRVDVIIWLDYKLPVVLSRLFRRNMWWWITGYSPWTGTRMSLFRAFSGLIHGLKSHGEKRSAYPGYLSKFSHKEIHVVSNSNEAEMLLNQLCVSHRS